MNQSKMLLVLYLSFFSVQTIAQELVIENDSLLIGGTLEVPDSTMSNKLVIMISGSGAQDRDETIFGFKPFEAIAEHLSKNGIASFRYDDREVGSSTGKFAEATLNDLVSDVEAIMNYFMYDSKTEYSDFILLGHSQGGMVATKTAIENNSVTDLILMASPIVPLKDVIDQQIIIMQKAQGKTEEEIQPTLDFQELAYEVARTNSGWEELLEPFKELVKYEIGRLPEAQQAYITDFDVFSEAQFKQQIAGLKSPQMRSLLFYDTGKDLSKLKIPVLGLFGEKDTQVPPHQNATQFEQVCSVSSANCTYKLISDANHLFQKANTGLLMEYSTLPKEFIPIFLESISTWVLK